MNEERERLVRKQSRVTITNDQFLIIWALASKIGPIECPKIHTSV